MVWCVLHAECRAVPFTGLLLKMFHTSKLYIEPISLNYIFQLNYTSSSLNVDLFGPKAALFCFAMQYAL